MKTNISGIYNNYNEMLEQLERWENPENNDGYIFSVDYGIDELPYHGYTGERLENEREIFRKVKNAYDRLVGELRNAVGK